MSDPLQYAADTPFLTPTTGAPAGPLDTPIVAPGGFDTTSGTEYLETPATTYPESDLTNAPVDTGSDSGVKQKAADAAADAKSKASDVASSAAGAGADVAAHAQDKAKEVVNTSTEQVKSLVDQVRGQLADQTKQQHQSAVSGLQALVSELSSMVDNSEADGPATRLVTQARDRAGELSGWLEAREPGDLMQDAKSYAQRKPGTFLLGAVVAGVVMGRLTRGVQAAHSDTVEPVATTGSYDDPSVTFGDYSSVGNPSGLSTGLSGADDLGAGTDTIGYSVPPAGGSL